MGCTADRQQIHVSRCTCSTQPNKTRAYRYLLARRTTVLAKVQFQPCTGCIGPRSRPKAGKSSQAQGLHLLSR
jgi:hypothetical protein